MKKSIFLLLTIILLVSCEHNEAISHRGKKINDKYHLEAVDSIYLEADSISGNGNFYLKDSVLTFADMTLCSLFQFDLNGNFLQKKLQKGNARNEIPALLYAYPISNSKDRTFIVDNSNFIYVLDDQKTDIVKVGRIDFGWDGSFNGYDSPSLYNLMFMTDFGMNITAVNDSTWMLPISIIDSYLGKKITDERYKKGHIFAEMDAKTFKVKKVFGKFPNIYKEKPSTLFEFFQYSKCNDTVYVNHAVDSLIYVYKYPDKLLYTMGYELNGANRKYSSHLSADHSAFKEEAVKISLNTGIYSDNGFIIRSIMKSMQTGETYLQFYLHENLVGEFKVPSMFHYLGYWKGFYYGVSFVPITKNYKQYFVLYKLKITEA